MPDLLEKVHAGLTTNQAPFVERAQRDGQLYIHQPYELYSERNHEAWRRVAAHSGGWRLARCYSPDQHRENAYRDRT